MYACTRMGNDNEDKSCSEQLEACLEGSSICEWRGNDVYLNPAMCLRIEYQAPCPFYQVINLNPLYLSMSLNLFDQIFLLQFITIQSFDLYYVLVYLYLNVQYKEKYMYMYSVNLLFVKYKISVL